VEVRWGRDLENFVDFFLKLVNFGFVDRILGYRMEDQNNLKYLS